MGKFIAAVLALTLLVVGFIDLVEPNGWGFLGKVGNGNVAVVTRFGKAQDEVLEPGMHVKSYFSTLNPHEYADAEGSDSSCGVLV